MESVCPEVVTSLLASGRSYKDISQELKALYPLIQHGLSERSIRRYIMDHNLRAQVEGYVLETVRESGIEVKLQPMVAQFQIKHTTIDQGCA